MGEDVCYDLVSVFRLLRLHDIGVYIKNVHRLPEITTMADIDPDNLKPKPIMKR